MSGAVPKIRLRGLSKAFGPKQVLDGVDLDIRAGHGMVILGGSGSGKSVTIKCILGLIEPDAGSIEIDGQNILKLPRQEREALNDRIGMLFQNGALFDSLPVWENVCFKLLAQKRITRARARRHPTHQHGGLSEMAASGLALCLHARLELVCTQVCLGRHGTAGCARSVHERPCASLNLTLPRNV